ncbi:hypothetical protein L9F63_010845 [Diploptera punctata]|uniref:COMM domain-containing protein 3 n=1 Tax=Diploptera punctata TaxID=6984 RepID=A0AAD8AFZ3_DIPPU|nr:hypothetical protein L9F63_010845 [Diploptera punctata]
MELSLNVVTGLKQVGNTNTITEDCFTKLIEAGISVVIDEENRKIQNINQLCNTKGDIVKEAYAAILCLLIEAARHDIDPDALSSALQQDYNFSSSRNEKFIKLYRQYKERIQASLSQIGIHPPHIVDAKWTLDYCVKASNMEQVGSFLYLIQFHTESCSEDPKKAVNKLKFLCTQEELQDLVWKLRDVVRHIEKIANA